MNRIRILFGIVVSVGVFAGSALADAPRPIVEVGRDVSITTSADCGNVQARVPALGPDRNSLVLAFDNFVTESTPETSSATKTCNLSASINVPPGMTMRPVRAFADGLVSTSETGSANVAFRYCVRDLGGPDEVSESFGPNTDGALQVVTTEYPEQWWSPCESGTSTTYIFDGYIRVNASHQPGDDRGSNVKIANSEAQTVRWIWDWGSCSFNQKRFKSQYTSPTGAWVHGYTQLSGSSGEYQPNGSQAKGVLRDVRYEDNGHVAKGYWEYQGSRGWFIFRSFTPGDTSFSGDWGYGETIGSDRRGYWNGQQ